jgi:uncharacterized membrane protein
MNAFLLMPVLITVLLVGLAIPMMMRKVPPNQFYGFRTRKTLSDPRIWFDANRRAGVNLVIAALLSVAIWAGLALCMGTDRAILAFIPLLLVMVLGSTTVSFMQLKKM